MRDRESVAEVAAPSLYASVNALRWDAEAMKECPRCDGDRDHAERDEGIAREPGKYLANTDRGGNPGKTPVQGTWDHLPDYAQRGRAAP